jgi:hypothetical protein
LELFRDLSSSERYRGLVWRHREVGSRATSVSDRQFRLNLHAAFDGPVAKLFRKTSQPLRPFWICHLNYRPLKMTDDYHPLRFDIPNLQTQTTDDVHRIERGGFGSLQFGDLLQDLRQAVKRDAGI